MFKVSHPPTHSNDPPAAIPSLSHVLTEHIDRVRGHDVLRQLIVDAVAIDDQGASVGLHDGRDVGRGDPAALGTDRCPRGDVLERLVAHYPPDLGARIRGGRGARQGDWVPDTCFGRTGDHDLGRSNCGQGANRRPLI